MAEKRVVVTGLGIISPNGIGRQEFHEAIFKGSSGIKPISLFDAAGFKAKTAGEVKDFTPQKYLGDKGLRFLDRSTKLTSSAARLALDDANLTIDEGNSRDFGVALGCTLGSLKSISDFDKDSITIGPKYVNPAHFPNTVMNSPASQISIRYNIQGFNTTVATGFTASLDAISYAYNFIKWGRVKSVLAGGVEELCVQTFLGFYKTNFLAGLKNGSPELSCPFDKRRNGIIFGEGSCILVLEDLEYALSRKAKIFAEVSGCGSCFEPFRIDKYSYKGDGLKRAMRMALENAKIAPPDIDCVCSGANSTPDGDIIETVALKEVFGNTARTLSISSIKSMIGECFSASGALQAAAAICAIENNAIFPTINYRVKDPRCDLNYVVNETRPVKVNKVLINAFGPSGHNSSLIISRFNN